MVVPSGGAPDPMHEESDVPMIERNYLFPGVIEMNYQARRRMGVNVFLIDGGTEYALIDIGFLDELSDVLERKVCREAGTQQKLTCFCLESVLE